MLRVRCPGPLGSRWAVCSFGALCCVCGVLGDLAPDHRCVRTWCCVAFAVSWATWLLSTGVPARCVVFRERCPGPLNSCSPVCPLSALCCVCAVLVILAPVHQCACSVCCVACVVSLATWLLFTGVPAWFVLLRVRSPAPLSSCSAVCQLGALRCVCGVLGHLVPGHRCARSGCCAACVVSWAPWLLFTGVHARSVVLCVRCIGRLGSCSPVGTLGVLYCVCGVLGHLAPAHRCARSSLCVACAVSSATWLPFTAVLARCVVLCVACAGLRATLLLFTGVRAGCAVLRVGTSLWGAHSSIMMTAFCSRQWRCTLRGRTRLSGQRLFRSRHWLGTLPGAHSSIQTAAVL